MKQRILIIGVVLALILTLVVPAAAYAKPTKPFGTAFQAHASMYVSSGGQVNLKWMGNGKMLMTTSDEIIEGQFTDSTWDAAEGSYLYVVHNSNVTLYPNGMFYGKSKDDISVTFNDAAYTTLTGTSQTSIEGHWSWAWDTLYQEWYISCEWVKDSGDFKIINGNISALGTWSAMFFPVNLNGYDTLATEAPATFNGTYYSGK